MLKSHEIEVEVTKLKKALLDGSIIPKPFCFLSGFFQPLQKFNLGNVQFFYAFEDRVDETNELTLLNS